MGVRDYCEDHAHRVAEGASTCARVDGLEAWCEKMEERIQALQATSNRALGMMYLIVFLVSLFGVYVAAKG